MSLSTTFQVGDWPRLGIETGHFLMTSSLPPLCSAATKRVGGNRMALSIGNVPTGIPTRLLPIFSEVTEGHN